MLSFEGSGRSIEKAIENALLELRAQREDVDIKILDEGGLFKKARVLVTISEDCKEKYEKKTKKIEEADEVLDIKKMFADLKKDKKESSVKEEPKKEVAKQKIEIEKKTDKLSGKDFIKGLLKELKIEANVFVEETPEAVNVYVEGGNSGDLIGYRGECLNAIQYVASIVESEYSESRKRLILDIEKYRSRREESLKALAHRMENKVIKINKSVRLEPMNANERRIIHTELQSSESVYTISKGIEPNRFIVILPKNNNNNESEETEE